MVMLAPGLSKKPSHTLVTFGAGVAIGVVLSWWCRRARFELATALVARLAHLGDEVLSALNLYVEDFFPATRGYAYYRVRYGFAGSQRRGAECPGFFHTPR